MKLTRKNRSSKRKSIKNKQRGGAWRCSKKDQDIQNLWKTTLRKLQENFDANYRGESHTFQKAESCNLWVWKHCETRDGVSENHLDIFWTDYNKYKLGISVKRNGKHIGGVLYFDLSDSEYDDQDYMGNYIASQIDNVYDNYLDCAKYDLTWAMAGSKLLNIDNKYIYRFDCNDMSFWKSNNPNYVVNVQWDDITASYVLNFTFYYKNKQFESDTYDLAFAASSFCSDSFFNQMAKALNEMYDQYD